MKSNAKRLKIIGLIIFIIVAFMIGKYAGSKVLDRDYISATIMHLGYLAPILFIGLYFVGTIFLFPGTPMTLTSGFLFGSIYGTIYVVIGASLGASITFFISRYLGKEFVDDLLKNKVKKLNKYDDQLKEHGFLTTLFLRLIPLFPFNGLNFAMGLTRVKFKDYFMGTFLGIIPGTFILVNIGSSAMEMNMFKFYLFIALFFLLAVSPKIYQKMRGKR